MSTLRNIGYFLVAVVLAKGVGFAQSFVVARALGPTDFGFWVTFGLIAAYSPIICLGTVETLVKEVPYYLGRKDLARVQQIEGCVLGSLVLAGLLTLIIGLSCLVLPANNVFGVGGVLLLVVFLAVAINMFTNYFYWRFAAYESFKSVAMLDTCRSFLALGLIAGMGWVWGLNGAVIGYLLHEIGMCALAITLSLRAYGGVRITFRRELLVHAVRVGFPITVVWWVLTLQASVDRVVLGSLVGAAAVGFFGLGISVANALALVPMVVGRVLYPKVNKQFGKEPDRESMRALVLAPTLAVAVLLANMQLVLLALMPLLYNSFLPKYRPGLAAGEILLVGSYFVCLLRNGANYLIATHKERVFLKYIVSTLLFNVVADLGLIKLGWGLEGVALGTSVAGLLLSTLVWRRVLVGLEFSRSEAWSRLMEMYLPFAVLTAVALLIHFALLSFLSRLNVLSVGMSLGLILLTNLGIGCFPVYRGAISQWRSKMRSRKDRVSSRLEVVDAIP